MPSIPIAELDGAGNLRATFLYGTRPHVPDAMVMANGTVYRFITDHVGSVRLVVNTATGEVAERLDYDGFGRVLQDTNPGLQPFGFAGGLYDDDTGLVRFGARDYDAYAGRWTAKDPILFEGNQANLCAYVANDTLNKLDPLTFSTGFSASGAAFGFGGSFSISGTFGYGSEGVRESGLSITVAGGAVAGIGGSVGVYAEWTDAERLNHLEGRGRFFGRSGLGPAYIGYVDAPGCYQGAEGSVGLGVGYLAAGAGYTQTWIFWEGPWQ
jgi:RHS repeat-associated protein